MPETDVPPLYAQWRRIAASGGERTAVYELRSGKQISFRELAEIAEAQHTAYGPLAVAAHGLEFIVQTLGAWRDSVPLIPLEAESGFDQQRLAGIGPEIVHVKQTSGTTGEPRLVVFEAGQLAADARQIISTMGIDQFGWNVAVISLAHSYGFSNLVLPLLLHGVPLLIGDGPLPAAVETALDAAGDSAVVPAVPAMWQAWHSAGILNGEQIALAISAGAPLALELEHAIHAENEIKVHNFYGSSECGGIAYDRSLLPRRDPHSVGSALDGVQLIITEDGTLNVKSAAVASGYWPMADDPALADAGHFQTADLAGIDANGSITLSGRRGETIHVAGRKVAPAEIERAIASLPGVDCCAVFGVPSNDPQRVEDIVACVNGDGNEAEWKALLQSHLKAWQIPRQWWRCSELSANARGKISRSEWRQRFLDGAGENYGGH